MQNVYKRVCDWNAARYDQEYDQPLTLKLLVEEYKEWCDAETEVDELDAICDVTYVAMGAIWKLGKGLNFIKMKEAFAIVNHLAETEMQEPMFFASAYLDYVACSGTLEGDDQWLYILIGIANAQALSMGISNARFCNAMNIVCDSNDSKTVKKTASNVKANVDKGAKFVAPEARLQKLLDQVAQETMKCQPSLH